MARRRSSGITSLAFNQDQGCFTCCLTSGLRVYNIQPLVEKAHYSKDELGEVSLCEMVFRTNWLLVVKARRPCSLMLLDDQQRAFRAEVQFKSPIRALRARKEKVAVVLPSSIQLLALPSLQRIALLRTPTTSRPLCAISTDPTGPQILIAPAHRTGSLQVLDITRTVKGAQSSSPTVIGCHQNDLVCVSVAPNGIKFATASARGTIIRLWDSVSKQMVAELRRGSDYADVFCISFNLSGSLVCCVSDKGTLHLWTAHSSFVHLAATAVTGSAAAAAPPHAPDARALCSFNDTDKIVVICEDGTFHKFTYSLQGSCHRSDFDYFLQVGEDDEFLQ
ncbi:WD repeat domain phosphoinositide-interacting protein 4 [Aphomia sociella]